MKYENDFFAWKEDQQGFLAGLDLQIVNLFDRCYRKELPEVNLFVWKEDQQGFQADLGLQIVNLFDRCYWKELPED